MIVIKSVSEIKENDFDEIWAIVRFPKKMESIKSKIIVPDLAPTSDLFGIYKELDNRGEWNSATFEDIYVPRFLKDIKKNQEARRLLGKLCKNERDEHKKIALICYCPKNREHRCHRSIIAGLLQGVGLTVETSLGLDYSKYFQMYKNIQEVQYGNFQ